MDKENYIYMYNKSIISNDNYRYLLIIIEVEGKNMNQINE